MTQTKRETVCDTVRDSYKHWTPVTLRYGDTDRQGHINNATYCTLFESGRVAFLFNPDGSHIAGSDRAFVIAKLTLDYLAEMKFPGTVEIGSKVLKIGSSSFTVGQGIFIADKCFSTAQSIVVLTDEATHKPAPMSEEIVHKLKELL